jgi:hypothetical protein
MEIIVLSKIDGLAQNFLDAPRVNIKNFELEIVYDFEMDSGEYGEKVVTFHDVQDYRHTEEKNVTVDMIKAYNSIGEVTDSNWISAEKISQGYNHYIIYFDEYGAYEIVAKGFQV